MEKLCLTKKLEWELPIRVITEFDYSEAQLRINYFRRSLRIFPAPKAIPAAIIENGSGIG